MMGEFKVRQTRVSGSILQGAISYRETYLVLRILGGKAGTDCSKDVFQRPNRSIPSRQKSGILLEILGDRMAKSLPKVLHVIEPLTEAAPGATVESVFKEDFT